ncbi:hypothetical protein [Nocardioides sp. SYSU DS0663]|uniref:hypothetical protein n=1 Tax=Nocardioides sp. SYSU DS0663 TaxID=3416445 RepID=UPI003F4B556D
MSGAAVLARTSRAEWSRVWSLRSSWVLAAVTVLAMVGLGSLIGVDAARDPSLPADATGWDGSRPTVMFALFGILALAVVAGTADHGTGGIVTTLQWTPRRGLLLLARVAVVAGTATVVGVAAVVAASGVVALWAPEVGLPLAEGVETLAGVAYVHGAGALLAVGLGLALRSTAGALVTVIALVLVLPLLLVQLPYDWTTTLAAAMPGESALFLIFGESPVDGMTELSARLTLAAWAVAAVAAGGWRLIRTDADH